jgi:serine/threonine protein kinase
MTLTAENSPRPITVFPCGRMGFAVVESALSTEIWQGILMNQNDNHTRKEDADFSRTLETGKPLYEIGSRIGGYKLLSVLGEGGFGMVYLAEQEHPIKRLVALKVIKPGMDTKQVIARLETERQALAMLDHPNIA